MLCHAMRRHATTRSSPESRFSPRIISDDSQIPAYVHTVAVPVPVPRRDIADFHFVNAIWSLLGVARNLLPGCSGRDDESVAYHTIPSRNITAVLARKQLTVMEYLGTKANACRTFSRCQWIPTPYTVDGIIPTLGTWDHHRYNTLTSNGLLEDDIIVLLQCLDQCVRLDPYGAC